MEFSLRMIPQQPKKIAKLDGRPPPFHHSQRNLRGDTSHFRHPLLPQRDGIANYDQYNWGERSYCWSEEWVT